jgi:putative DNA primase/helicase
MRLVKEHGRDIRYNTSWKKWVVWNGKYWEMDEGGVLIHEKGLEMVRNIYDELKKTADYRERIDNEKAAKGFCRGGNMDFRFKNQNRQA